MLKTLHKTALNARPARIDNWTMESRTNRTPRNSYQALTCLLVNKNLHKPCYHTSLGNLSAHLISPDPTVIALEIIVAKHFLRQMLRRVQKESAYSSNFLQRKTHRVKHFILCSKHCGDVNASCLCLEHKRELLIIASLLRSLQSQTLPLMALLFQRCTLTLSSKDCSQKWTDVRHLKQDWLICGNLLTLERVVTMRSNGPKYLSLRGIQVWN
mmetsp:Transcript_6661/g.23543  ORF Transcript_6661/g.23543 Transcript_6661/m.23543 type:complete len:213 (+) Transcript_6661:301-939(+)